MSYRLTANNAAQEFRKLWEYAELGVAHSKASITLLSQIVGAAGMKFYEQSLYYLKTWPKQFQY